MSMTASLKPKRNRRTKSRELLCPLHPEVKLLGNGKKYFLHLLSPEELRQRGMSDKKAKLIINAYPVLVLSNEWLEELYCVKCQLLQWYYIVKHDKNCYSVSLAKRELWSQVAHVDISEGNPTVSQYTKRNANRFRNKRADNKNFFDKF